MTASIDFYFDVVSPFAYIAIEILRRYQPLWNVDIKFHCIYLGGVMSLSGNKPPLSVPNKGIWINRDRELTCKYWDIDMQMPNPFPFNTIMRFLRQLQEEQPNSLQAAAVHIMRAVFSSEKADVKTTESILKILHNAPGLSLSAAELQGVIARSGEEANKARLKADTEKLVKEQQAFGAPWMLVTREDGQQRAFWGSDRFELMAWWMGKEWHGAIPREGKAKL